MTSFIRALDRSYYEGEQGHALDQPCTVRPSSRHLPQFDQNGVFTGWLLDPTLEAQNVRVATDGSEAGGFIADANLMALLDMTPQNISDTIDAQFPALTAGQRTMLKRIAQLAQMGARGAARTRGGFKLG